MNDSASTTVAEVSVGKPPGYGQVALTAAAWGVGWLFIHAPIVACLYRFPVPFAGYVSGPSALIGAVFATFFYGVLLGGFFPVAVVGAIGGVIIKSALGDDPQVLRFAKVCGIIVSLAGVLLLAVLDKLIGPW